MTSVAVGGDCRKAIERSTPPRNGATPRTCIRLYLRQAGPPTAAAQDRGPGPRPAEDDRNRDLVPRRRHAGRARHRGHAGGCGQAVRRPPTPRRHAGHALLPCRRRPGPAAGHRRDPPGGQALTPRQIRRSWLIPSASRPSAGAADGVSGRRRLPGVRSSARAGVPGHPGDHYPGGVYVGGYGGRR
jgi:hypothetical protein